MNATGGIELPARIMTHNAPAGVCSRLNESAFQAAQLTTSSGLPPWRWRGSVPISA